MCALETQSISMLSCPSTSLNSSVFNRVSILIHRLKRWLISDLCNVFVFTWDVSWLASSHFWFNGARMDFYVMTISSESIDNSSSLMAMCWLSKLPGASSYSIHYFVSKARLALPMIHSITEMSIDSAVAMKTRSWTRHLVVNHITRLFCLVAKTS